ncbi:MAG: class II fructose-bisphosphate aldolase [Armatimonadetes bacterium]|nr:class II fructose-bisphosphate aldolase [Armatimonadota bacterium]
MALVPLSKLLADAAAGGYAVGYFEAWDMYSLEAVVQAAEAERSPVVLGFGGMMMDPPWLERFGIEPMGAYGRVMAERANVPAALILNEVFGWTQAERGAHAGFNVVMVNTCHFPFEHNLKITRQVAEVAHPLGVEVQAELGRLPNFGQDEPGEPTDPDQAREFVAATGVDCLAVSVGNVHLQTEGSAEVDWDRLKAIRAAVEVPLVIHGGSGLDADTVTRLIGEGITLFHVGTVMKRWFWEATHKMVTDYNAPFSYQTAVGSRLIQDFLVAGQIVVEHVVGDLMQLYGSSGKAE